MAKPVVILGAGGHARVIADILVGSGREVMGFFDDNPSRTNLPFPLLGRLDDAIPMLETVDFIIGIGDNRVRETVAVRLGGKANYACAVHPDAVVAQDVQLHSGTVIMAGSVINTGTTIGYHCIINTGSTVDHDSDLEAFVHVSPGAHLAGAVKIGCRTWVGIGGIISNNVTVCQDVTIGAGGVVIRDIVCPGTYIGIPVHRVGAAI